MENKEIVVTLQKIKRFYGFVLRGEVKLPTAFLFLKRDFCNFVREYSRTIGHNIGPEKPMNEYYRHFRNGKLYRFVTFATIEATGEEAVVYQAMYGDHRYWIRPRANFFEEVEYEGKMVPRFQKVENAGE